MVYRYIAYTIRVTFFFLLQIYFIDTSQGIIINKSCYQWQKSMQINEFKDYGFHYYEAFIVITKFCINAAFECTLYVRVSGRVSLLYFLHEFLFSLINFTSIPLPLFNLCCLYAIIHFQIL